MFYLESLILKNYRNYNSLKLSFHHCSNIITGANGQGKTNLIEAIYYLSVTRSFRTSRDQDLPGFESNCFYLRGNFIRDDLKSDLQLSYSDSQLNVFIDQKKANRFDHLQRFPVVVFSPDDLLIIREGPATRRRFINLEASRMSRVYFYDLRAYQRILQQRNQLLRECSQRRGANSLLEPWDDSLVSLGGKIIRFRKELIKALEEAAVPFYALMAGASEELKLVYSSSFVCSGSDDGLENSFREELIRKRDLEFRRKVTAVGPHLDDLKILINGQDSRRFSSQGQKRTAALALKMAEAKLLQHINNEWPIILLDDVFSELDSFRKEKLLNFVANNNGQYFITSAAELDWLPGQPGTGYKEFAIKKGMVADENE